MGSDNADWELEEGLPQFEDPFIQQYLKGRDALIAEEQKRRHGKITGEPGFHKI
jgi:adenosine deaminase CECR1